MNTTMHARVAPQQRKRLAALTIGAIGVVFGDIGTSPLYAFKEAFGGTRALALTQFACLRRALSSSGR
ncbi:MAG: KUP/HAK/KT family potassium transporter [Rhodopseudomonas palustris]|nr:KUP/HAK/KT family potassium transporter [Rhodopseudomonas palustris]